MTSITTSVKVKAIAAGVLVLMFMFSLIGINMIARGAVSPPSFPACSDIVFYQEGNPHYDSGPHGVPGIGTFEGSDDVYSQENGNYLQCFCYTNLEEPGWETLWWNITGLNLTQEEKNAFKGEGWQEETGVLWGLPGETYLAKNINFSCSGTTPTPTPTTTVTITPTPTTTVTPTQTPTPTPTTTPHEEENEPHCVGLSASPSDGTAPLTVKFNGSGFDKNGPILEYEFDFGDSSGFQDQVVRTTDSEVTHRYEDAGTYIASLRVKDQGGTWRDGNDDCKITIDATGKPKVLGAKTPSELPSAGASVLALSSLVPLGYYLYRRFKIL
jgi:hypothetical protein